MTLEIHGFNSTEIKFSTIPHPPVGLPEMLIPTASQEAHFHQQRGRGGGGRHGEYLTERTTVSFQKEAAGLSLGLRASPNGQR